MKSAGAEVHHYDVTNDDKLFAEFLKSQMSLGSLNTAAQVHHPELRDFGPLGMEASTLAEQNDMKFKGQGSSFRVAAAVAHKDIGNWKGLRYLDALARDAHKCTWKEGFSKKRKLQQSTAECKKRRHELKNLKSIQYPESGLKSTRAGFVESLPVFREILPEQHSYKLQTMTQDTMGLTFNAHSALEHDKALQSLVIFTCLVASLRRTDYLSIDDFGGSKYRLDKKYKCVFRSRYINHSEPPGGTRTAQI
uniref:Uncharacterized protein n=1 Tax=Magallana gigas TaxID=29159 RepID=K1Q3Q4_MAGGI